MPTRRELHVSTPNADHEAINRAAAKAFQGNITLRSPNQYFLADMNRAVVAKYRACVPDGVVGIFLVKDILDALGRKVSAVALMQDVAVFEMANMETTESVVQSVSTCACSTVFKTL